MLKSRVGQSIKEDSYDMGVEVATEATKNMNHLKLNNEVLFRT